MEMCSNYRESVTPVHPVYEKCKVIHVGLKSPSLPYQYRILTTHPYTMMYNVM